MANSQKPCLDQQALHQLSFVIKGLFQILNHFEESSPTALISL